MNRRRVYARLVWAPGLLLALSLGVAMFIFFRNSLFSYAGMGMIVAEPGITNFQKLLTDTYYAEILLKTTLVSAAVVAICAAISLPITLYLRHLPSLRADFYFIVVLASSAMSLVVRALGWISILNDDGPINSALLALGIVDSPVTLIGTNGAIIAGLVHGFIPVFVLTLYPITQSIDPSLEQAAEGMGATRWQILLRVLIPLSLPGLVSASLLTFAMCMGAYTTPALLSGGRAMVFPILIQQQAMIVLNYPMAAALALVLTLIVLAITWLSIAVAARGEIEAGR